MPSPVGGSTECAASPKSTQNSETCILLQRTMAPRKERREKYLGRGGIGQGQMEEWVGAGGRDGSEMGQGCVPTNDGN